MRICTAQLESTAPYFQSRYVGVPKLDKETGRDYEERNWRERIHADENGNVFIPAAAFHKCLQRSAAMLSMQIPGKGKATYTKHFKAGIMVPEGITLPIKKDDVPGLKLLLNADGKSGGGTRVERTMPFIAKWSGTLTVYVVDNTITREVFEQHLREAGLIVGIGQNRPENGGSRGRFQVVGCSWAEK